MRNLKRVIYRCGCMTADVELYIIARDPRRDVGEWIGGPVIASITYDHRSRSPLCQAAALEYLKIPTDEDVPLGANPTAQ